MAGACSEDRQPSHVAARYQTPSIDATRASLDRSRSVIDKPALAVERRPRPSVADAETERRARPVGTRGAHEVDAGSSGDGP